MHNFTINKAEQLCVRAEELIRSGTKGRFVAVSLCNDVDALLASTLNNLLHREGASILPDVALVAVGGYGRGELAPYSDIDIMILSRNRDEQVTGLAQAFFYRLWDLNLNISNSFRTLSECVPDALADVKTRTSLIDSRFVAGSRTVYNDFRRDIYGKILRKDTKGFVADILRDIQLRHRTFGDSLYLLEPNVKDGRGGLRDLQALAWLRLVAAAGTADDESRLAIAHDLLLRIRVALHFLARRKDDVLSFEHQGAVAETLGFKDLKGFFGEEVLMRLYYRQAKVITDALGRLSRQSGRRFFGFAMPFRIKKINERYAVFRNELALSKPGPLVGAAEVLEAFIILATTGKRFNQQLREAIAVAAQRFDKGAWLKKQVAELFMNVLKCEHVYETLSEMHDLGVLDRILPEFGRLRHLVIYEIYHRYTVDEHSLIAIRNLNELRFSKELRHQHFAEMLAQAKREILFLAILLHDIGKGASGNHEEAGYRLIKDIVVRLHLQTEDRALVAFLVRNHILLSHLALSRDIEAPETVANLAELVENEQSLMALYLMTYADMTAVNPAFWTQWKASLLDHLFQRTRELLTGTKARFVELADERLRRFVQEMPPRYVIGQTEDSLVRDYQMVLLLNDQSGAVRVQQQEDGTAELTVVTMDRPGLFCRIVWALSSRSLNILRARLHTGSTGLVIDKIVISNWKNLWWEGMEQAIVRDLQVSISGPGPEQAGGLPAPAPLLGERLSHYKRFASSIEADNETSATHTLVELHLPDRLGLLYDIADKLHSLNIDISAAVINTEEGIANDVFYVQSLGAKLDEVAVLKTLSTLAATELDH